MEVKIIISISIFKLKMCQLIRESGFLSKESMLDFLISTKSILSGLTFSKKMSEPI